MTLQATSWAWRQGDLKPADKLVLVAMSDSTHDDGWCSASRMSLAEVCGMTIKTVDAAMRRLEAAGILRIEGHQVWMLVEGVTA